MEKEIEDLKLRTMRPPLFVDDLIVSIETKLLYDSPKWPEKQMLERQLNRYRIERDVEQL